VHTTLLSKETRGQLAFYVTHMPPPSCSALATLSPTTAALLGAPLLVNPLLHPGARKQVNLAKQMDKVAANYDWKFIVNTGDNFYQCVSARLVVVACCFGELPGVARQPLV
jgi:hypothetical protein